MLPIALVLESDESEWTVKGVTIKDDYGEGCHSASHNDDKGLRSDKE
jgi:hypothetical protein